MKRKVLGGALLVLASSAALAQEVDRLATRRGLEIGGQLADYHYEEPDVMKVTGFRAGVVGAYTFTLPSRVFFKIDGRANYGVLKYEGSGTKSGVPDFIFEVRGLAGMDFRAGSKVRLSPYLGLGYRYLYDDLTGYSSTGAAGYRRYSNYVYAPIGLTLRLAAGSSWVFAPTAEYDLFLQGKQKSMLSDANAGFNDVTNTQKSGYGYRVYLMFERDKLSVGPYLHYWHINNSDVQPIGGGFAGLEPENWTREVGVEIRFRF